MSILGLVGRKPPVLQHNANKLAFEQFSELNALLYRTNPSEYFRMRLHGVALHADQGPESVSLPSGATLWLPAPDTDTRTRYAAMEMVVLFHHVAETLIRAFLAHRGHPLCPWMEIAKLNNFRKFKEQTDSLVNREAALWDRSQLGQVFLGGHNAADAEVDISDEEWEDHLDGLIQLMVYVGSRFLVDAALYNSAKHGLSSIAEASMQVRLSQGMNSVQLIDGPVLAYLRTIAKPENPPSEHYEWNLSITGVSLEADIRVIELSLLALEAIWGVARRAYTGTSSQTWLLTRAYVDATLLKGRTKGATEIVHTTNHRMATASREAAPGRRRISGIEVQMTGDQYSSEFVNQVQLFDLDASPPRQVELPLRSGDGRGLTHSNQHFFPFSPRGSHTRPDPETIVGDAPISSM